MWLHDNLPADALLCNGAGNYAARIHRFFRFRRFGQHVAPAPGSMGYGVPAAVAMKRLYPDRQVIRLAGDGDFLMNRQEIATAAICHHWPLGAESPLSGGALQTKKPRGS